MIDMAVPQGERVEAASDNAPGGTGSDDQVASTDEYQIALAEGVEDDTLLDDASETKRFSITSYGADYAVDGLVKRMKAGAFLIPEFQRRFVWSQRHASKSIESLLMGLPVPGIFLYREADTNKHLVLDGQQRLRTLQAFYDGVFGDKKFKLQGVIDEWSGKSYSELLGGLVVQHLEEEHYLLLEAASRCG